MRYDPLEAARRTKNYKPYEDPKEVGKHNYLPEPTGDRVPYMVSLSSDCPRGEISLLGITFTRGQFTPRTSTQEFPKPVAFFVLLSQNQKEAVEEAARVKIIEFRDERNQRVEAPVLEYIQLTEYPWGSYENIELLEEMSSKVFSFDAVKNVEDQRQYIAWLEKHIKECKEKSGLFEELKEKGQQFEPEKPKCQGCGSNKNVSTSSRARYPGLCRSCSNKRKKEETSDNASDGFNSSIPQGKKEDSAIEEIVETK